MIYHQLPSRLPSFCIWQFSTCHVEIKIRKFKVLPILHVQIRIWKPRQTEFCKGTGRSLFIRPIKNCRYHERILCSSAIRQGI
jgi:hypothetical protein